MSDIWAPRIHAALVEAGVSLPHAFFVWIEDQKIPDLRAAWDLCESSKYLMMWAAACASPATYRQVARAACECAAEGGEPSAHLDVAVAYLDGKADREAVFKAANAAFEQRDSARAMYSACSFVHAVSLGDRPYAGDAGAAAAGVTAEFVRARVPFPSLPIAY